MYSRCSHRLFLILLLLGQYSCRDRQKESDPDRNNQDRIIVSMEVLASHPDQFELYYHESDESFSSEKRVVQEVKGTGEFERIDFVMEPLVFPTRIRIDLGQNQKQKVITLRNLVFRYNDASHEFTPQEIQKYFRPNSFVDFDFETMQARIKPQGDKYDPFLMSYDISYFVNKLILF